MSNLLFIPVSPERQQVVAGGGSKRSHNVIINNDVNVNNEVKINIAVVGSVLGNNNKINIRQRNESK
jgi:hypothetical protein